MYHRIRLTFTLVTGIIFSTALNGQIFQPGYTQGPIRHNSFHYEIVLITHEMVFSPQAVYERIFFEYPNSCIGISAGLGPYIGGNSFGATGRIGTSIMTNKMGIEHFELGLDGLYIFDLNTTTGEIVPQLKFGYRLDDIYKKKIRFKAGINIGPVQIIKNYKEPYDYLGAYIGFIHRI